jgi:hypothetical protein
LVTSDIDYALKIRSIEVKKRIIIKFWLQFQILIKFFKPVYGFYSNDRVPFRSLSSVGGTGAGRCLYYQEDQVLDLNDLINTNNSSVKLPNDFVINGE